MGYLRLLLLNNLEVILNVFKLFTSSEIFVSYFIYNLNHFKLKKSFPSESEIRVERTISL